MQPAPTICQCCDCLRCLPVCLDEELQQALVVGVWGGGDGKEPGLALTNLERERGSGTNRKIADREYTLGMAMGWITDDGNLLAAT
jgi:hypothetical protein